jgi:hypothetical protein
MDTGDTSRASDEDTENNAAEGAPHEPDGGASAGKSQRPKLVRVRTAIAPFPRAGAYYARAWRRYLSRREGDIPVARPTVALAGNALLDELLLAAFRVVRRDSPESERARIAQETIAALEMYERAGWLANPDLFYESPPALDDPEMRSARSRRGLSYMRISFDSLYEPRTGDPGRERWLGYEANRQAWAWMLQHDGEPRPWLLCVHGAQMGRPEIDLNLFRARWLHEDLGLNVLLPVLPLHGPRRQGAPKGAGFIREDMLDNVHGAAQSVWDIRRLVSWIRGTHGDVPIGVTGVSLGGYVTSLVASTEDGLACAIVGVPVVDIADMMLRHGGLRLDEDRRRMLELGRELTHVVSPLALTPRVPLEDRFVFAGVADRLMHPAEQVVRLWKHWGQPRIEWYQGGHAGFSRSKPVRQFLLDALIQSGLVDEVHGTTGRVDQEPASTGLVDDERADASAERLP